MPLGTPLDWGAGGSDVKLQGLIFSPVFSVRKNLVFLVTKKTETSCSLLLEVRVHQHSKQ